MDMRPIRDLTPLKFVPMLEDLSILGSEVTDLTPLTALPHLKSVRLQSSRCEDFRPLAQCGNLRKLKIRFEMHWPDLSGLETLEQLEELSLEGNLIALKPGLRWCGVHTAELICSPLAARSARDLPQLPNCEFLKLGGVERLDGIEAFPLLRNFTPLTALSHLTWFSYKGDEPLDVSPLARLPKLYFAAFETKHIYGLDEAPPRDFSPLTDAPALRELSVKGCPPVEAEVATLNSTFLPWDDLFLAPAPRPLPKLVMKIMPRKDMHEQVPVYNTSGREDDGIIECETRWLKKFAERAVGRAIGIPEWGEASPNPSAHQIYFTVQSPAVLEKFPQFIEAARTVLARLQHDCNGFVMICLKAPAPEPTPEQKKLEEKFQEEQDDAEYEIRLEERKEYLERLHRFRLLQQQGTKVSPEEFAAPPPKPLPDAPWERDKDEEDDDSDEDSGSLDVKVMEHPDPPPSLLDDEHPLAGNYRIHFHLNLDEIRFDTKSRALAVYLMNREPDVEIPESPEA
jgi:hypothetical protein